MIETILALIWGRNGKKLPDSLLFVFGFGLYEGLSIITAFCVSPGARGGCLSLLRHSGCLALPPQATQGTAWLSWLR